jgi:hypothetical protein
MATSIGFIKGRNSTDMQKQEYVGRPSSVSKKHVDGRTIKAEDVMIPKFTREESSLSFRLKLDG